MPNPNEAQEDAVHNITVAIHAAYDARPDDRHRLIVEDILTDLRHYCDCYGLKFAQCDREAQLNYLNDIGEL